MAKVLVTGGCGYIGSHCVVDLIHAGHEVTSVDNYMNSSPNVLESIQKITGVLVKNHAVDLCNLPAMDKVFSEVRPNAIIHFAALKSVPESVSKPLLYYRNNLVGVINLLEMQKKFQVKDLIFSSSCSVYGNPSVLPVTEDTPMGIAESPYAHTKQVSEEIMRNFSASHPDFRFIFLRYFNPAGAHDSILMGESPTNEALNLVPVITETAMGKRSQMWIFGDDYDTRDGTCVRDFIHVMDLAAAHTLSLNRMTSTDTTGLEIFNLGTGRGITVKEAIQSFERISNVTLNYKVGPRREGDVISIYSDYTQAAKLLGWKPQRGIDEIMDTAWKWEQVRSKSLSDS
ncbi:MAG: UDP-glucose 4-epimerase GalE [Saprospiraceae bacterium]|nr:UDP-glucose 4-epimerase GalE [Saprospiraceae bacterium]